MFLDEARFPFRLAPRQAALLYGCSLLEETGPGRLPAVVWPPPRYTTRCPGDSPVPLVVPVATVRSVQCSGSCTAQSSKCCSVHYQSPNVPELASSLETYR